ncbi:MAG: hypothetical protein KIG36_06315 [Eubacteriales bacterium]|nr:hypothetical protein [Eubacteriales bacterium]
MNTISEKVAYIKGLAEGLKLSDETAEGKILLKLIEVVDELAQDVDNINKDMDEMDDYVSAMDEDLAEVEEELFGDEDDECECDECDECDCEGMSKTECPNCHQTVYFDQELLDGDDEICCPDCGANLFPEEE